MQPFVDREDAMLGLEYAGILENGRRVMGICKAESMANTIITDIQDVFKVPDNWTLEEAATIAVCYMTAYLGLVIRGQLQRGQSVLIHSGSGWFQIDCMWAFSNCTVHIKL